MEDAWCEYLCQLPDLGQSRVGDTRVRHVRRSGGTVARAVARLSTNESALSFRLLSVHQPFRAPYSRLWEAPLAVAFFTGDSPPNQGQLRNRQLGALGKIK